jgi:Cu(I)/Ag(I) efflux system membrane fusion protein
VEFQSQLVKLWEGYISLQEALSDDDFSLAQQAIKHFQASLSSVDAGPLAEDAHKVWKKEYSNLVQILHSIGQTENLKSIRKNFSSLSDELMVLVKTFGPAEFGTIYQLHCPMVFDGRGAFWLQNNKQVENPYFGTTMLKCADSIKLFSGNKMEAPKEEHHHE